MKTVPIVSPEEVHRCAVEHGWYGGSGVVPSLDFVPSKLALIHSEVSEALEGYRNHDMKNFGEEMADVVIRVFDLCQYLGIDIVSAVEAKHMVNLGRPYKHGGKLV